MGYELGKQSATFPSSGDLSASLWRGMKIDSAGRAAVAASGDSGFIGVLQNKPAAIDREAVLTHGGITKMEAGGAITAGAPISTDADGKAVAVASGEPSFGTAVEAAAADGDIIPVLLKNRHLGA